MSGGFGACPVASSSRSSRRARNTGRLCSGSSETAPWSSARESPRRGWRDTDPTPAGGVQDQSPAWILRRRRSLRAAPGRETGDGLPHDRCASRQPQRIDGMNQARRRSTMRILLVCNRPIRCQRAAGRDPRGGPVAAAGFRPDQAGQLRQQTDGRIRGIFGDDDQRDFIGGAPGPRGGFPDSLVDRSRFEAS